MTKLGEKLIAAAKEGVKIARGVILPAGSFRVSDYRKPMPVSVKLQAMLNAVLDEQPWFSKVTDAGDLRFDHRPPLQDRDFDLEAGDFIPPQNDPDHIEVIPNEIHNQRTFGRREGAQKTVTVLNSDVHNRTQTRKIRNTQELHELKIATKRGDPVAIAKLLKVEKQPRHKRKIPSRPFSSTSSRDATSRTASRHRATPHGSPRRNTPRRTTPPRNATQQPLDNAENNRIITAQ